MDNSMGMVYSKKGNGGMGFVLHSCVSNISINIPLSLSLFFDLPNKKNLRKYVYRIIFRDEEGGCVGFNVWV